MQDSTAQRLIQLEAQNKALLGIVDISRRVDLLCRRGSFFTLEEAIRTELRPAIEAFDKQ